MLLTRFFRRRKSTVVERINDYTNQVDDERVLICGKDTLSLAKAIQREEGGELILREDCPPASIYTLPRSRYFAGIELG